MSDWVRSEREHQHPHQENSCSEKTTTFLSLNRRRQQWCTNKHTMLQPPFAAQRKPNYANGQSGVQGCAYSSPEEESIAIWNRSVSTLQQQQWPFCQKNNLVCDSWWQSTSACTGTHTHRHHHIHSVSVTTTTTKCLPVCCLVMIRSIANFTFSLLTTVQCTLLFFACQRMNLNEKKRA